MIYFLTIFKRPFF